MKKIFLITEIFIIFIFVSLKSPAFCYYDFLPSHIHPVLIYSEIEKHLRDKWSAYAVPAKDTREVLKENSYAVWFTQELGEAWYQNKNQQNLWSRRERWRARGKLNDGLNDKLQFQFYLKANTEELKLNEEELYGIKVYLGDDRGNVFEPVKLEKGPLDELVHNDFYQFTAYFNDRNPETL